MKVRTVLLALTTMVLATSIALAAGTTKAAAGGDYVGTDTCVGCHEESHKRFKNTVMGKIFANPRSPAEAKGCESCHGPGKAHVEAGGGKDTIPVNFGKDSKQSVQEQNAACIDCHNRGMQIFWKGSPHEMRGMTCVACHTIKAERKETLLAANRFTDAVGNEHQYTKPNQTELCLSCHQMRRAQLQRSSHMPFREGKINCSSCHNPHGSPNPKQLTEATVTENCVRCHTERRGPFLWEHAPVTENCDNCHEPHGTSNPQLLKVRQPRVCNSCHITARHPSTPSLANSTRVYNRSCTNCHVQIHGSNHPSGNMYTR